MNGAAQQASQAAPPLTQQERIALFTRLYQSDPSFILLGMELRGQRIFGDAPPLPDVPGVGRLVDETKPHAAPPDASVDAPPGSEPQPSPLADATAEGEPDPADGRTLGAHPSARATIYPSLKAFVERFLVHVFAYSQHTGAQFQWVPDWWRHPSIVFPLDAVWRGYEAAATGTGGEMESWYFQTIQLLRMVFDKDTGLSDSVSRPLPAMTTLKDEPLPVVRPGAQWRQQVLDAIDPVDRIDGEEPAEPEEEQAMGHARTRPEAPRSGGGIA
ncbi:MAG: DUF4913 domain-containing protein [Bifidobacterium tibiigranuli]|jgi:hypothetical protein|uniref:DUF4913 domain-containing protein n=1 Tax=Bifidobacterium tibiigranuli TaxID=2172043 RepID=UPI0026ECBA12|nr:DUF4913 domain-containing protein [Bifidobacterium tibiigranuli]MCI1674247.1 DUF4913 domain-containing protein [Bifidobacterium tibiigranuli]MCI1713473.1 DUF4913 domain-containing protein [Bifidobacterium tibiigranuli]